jgi:hypothetical protein
MGEILLYSYREFIDLYSDGILSHEEKLAKRNLEILQRCTFEKNAKKPASNVGAGQKPQAGQSKRNPRCPRCSRRRT